MNKQKGNEIIDKFIPHRRSSNSKYLAYHENWNWLMPVVDKIEKTLDRSTVVTIRSKSVSIAEGSQEFNKTFYGNTRLKAVWKGCVRFIKWYNENNNPLDHTPTPEESPYLYKRKESYV